jgi:hypothetical protein
MNTPFVLATLLVAPLLSACNHPDSTRAAAPVVRDSAGITIVENAAPKWAPGEAWTLSAEPLVIGSLDGPPEYQLFNVAAAIRLPDGRILLGNSGSGELRYFDATGKYLKSVGRLGDGPGEYRGIEGIELSGDSLLVIDRLLGRVSVLDVEGMFARDFPIPLPRTMRGPSGRFGDGTLLFGGIDLMLDGGGPAEGRRRDPMRYFRVSTEGQMLDTVGVFDGPERVTQVSSQGGRTAIRLLFVSFGPVFTIRAHGDGLIAALGKSYELSFLRADGSLNRLVRRSHTPEPVTDADLRSYTELRRRQAIARGDASNNDQVDPLTAEFFSAYGPVVLDALGNAWVSDYRHPWKEGALAWSVFDAEGTWLGEVRLPDKLRILEIGGDYLIALLRDDLDVEYAHVYQIDKPRG